MKFKVKQIIVTDDDGFLAIKALLPNESIEWVRSIDDTVIVKLKDDINLEYVEKTLNSIHRTLQLQ